MAIKYLDAKRVRGSSTAAGADEEIVLDDNPSSQHSWSNAQSGYAPTTPTPSNENNYNGVFINTNSALVGKSLKKIKAYLCKVGSPNTSGTIRLGVCSGTGSGSTITWVTGAYVDIENLISGESGGVTLNTGFPAVPVPIEVTLPTPHTLAANDTIALGLTGGNYGSGTNVAWQYSDGTGVYDGSNTSRNRFSGGSWTGSGMASDMHCTVTCGSSVDEKTTLVTVPPTGSADFDGSNDKVTLGGSNTDYNFLTSGSFSIACWVYPDAISNNNTFFDNTNGSASANGLVIRWEDSEMKIVMMFGKSGGGDGTVKSDGNEMATGEWQHLCFTFDGSTAKIYRNGTEIKSGSYTGYSGTANAVPALGFTISGGDSAYNGKVDDFLITNDILTTTEITALASGTAVADVSPAIGNQKIHYTFTTNFNDSAPSGLGNGTAYQTTIVSSGKQFNNTSNLPENTLFEETDTYKTYWLQDNAWALTKPSPLNMTYANSTAADAVWIPDGDRTTGEGIIKIDTTNNYLKDYWDTTTSTFRLSQNTYDLGSSLGTTWTVQYTVNFSNWRDPTSSNYVWGIGMWGSPSSSSMNTSQDRLVCFVNNSSAWTIWDTSGATASGDGSMGALQNATGTTGSPSAVPSASTNSKDWFVTLQKVDATKYTVVVREDSHAGTIIGARKEQTWQSGTPSSFRYFGAKCTMSNSARTGMIIKDVLVYDGALVGSI